MKINCNTFKLQWKILENKKLIQIIYLKKYKIYNNNNKFNRIKYIKNNKITKFFCKNKLNIFRSFKA